jgi:hypothetical protein
MCVESVTSYAKHCKGPSAEQANKKDEANFCQHFKPKVGPHIQTKKQAEIEKGYRSIDKLFVAT